VHLVTVLEEMPVQETADGIEELRRIGLPVGGVVVNMARPQDLDAHARQDLLAGTEDRAALTSALGEAGVAAGPDLVDALVTEGRHHAERRRLEDAQRALVGRLGVPTVELPLLPGGVDLDGLYDLARTLTREGLA
ncbi:MAG: arsA 3, partial [Marmoricola sp.]|nr:arsA 3 [Marmoricola sp.]